MAVIDELVIMLGLKADSGAARAVGQIENAIGTVTKVATVAGIALTATMGAVTAFVSKYAEGAAQIQKFSDVTGVATDDLQRWGYAVEKAGGNAQSLMGDIKSLTESMHSPIPGEFNQGLFMMGVSTRKSTGELKNASDVFLDLAGKFEKMSDVKALNWAKKVGISEDTLLLLKQGRDTVGQYLKQAEAFVVDEQSLKNAKEFTIQMTMLRRVVDFVGQSIAGAAGPELKKLVETFTGFLAANRELMRIGIKTFLEGISQGFYLFWEGITKVKDAILDFFPGLKDFNKEMMTAENIGQVVSLTLGVIAGIIAFMAAKFLILAAAIGVAILVFEDIMTYFRGGESVLGLLIDKIKDLYKSFADKFPGIAGLIEVVYDLLVKIGAWFAGEIWDSIKQFGEYLKELATEAEFYFTTVLNMIEAVASAILNIPEKIAEITDKIKNLAQSIGGKIKGFFGYDEEPEEISLVKKIMTETKEPKTVGEKLGVPTIPIFNQPTTAEIPSVFNEAARINNTDNRSNKNVKQEFNFNIVSPDPLLAGEQVRKEFDMMNSYPGELKPVTQ